MVKKIKEDKDEVQAETPKPKKAAAKPRAPKKVPEASSAHAADAVEPKKKRVSVAKKAKPEKETVLKASPVVSSKSVTPKPAEKVIEKAAQPKKAEEAKAPSISAVKPVPVQPEEKIAKTLVIEEAVPVASAEEAVPERKTLEFDCPIGLKDLAAKLNVRPNELIVNLMAKNIFATITQSLGEDLVVDILAGYNIDYKRPPKIEDQIRKEHREMEEKQDVKHLATRPPVVTFMGHVDHGKTSLLDYIRKTRVAAREKGGITQHIGSYEIKLPHGSVTFLDTPGHAAFTAMRARGANATDVVVLVVAADDGVMPQTKEALDHARAADVTIVVAINKCDLPSANIEKVKGQLSQIGLSPEDWGGKTICLPVSAKTGEGVDQLLEMLLLESELLELKANPSLRARGVVIEGKLSSGQGPVATLLVKNGTLKVGDMIVSGMHYGRIKAMMDHTGQRVHDAPPSKPVSVLGLSGVPQAGDEFFAVKDEKKARTIAMLKQDEHHHRRLKSSQRMTLENFYNQMKEGAVKTLTILMKGDVQGSIEALQKSLLDQATKDVTVNVIHADVGNINESDIMLAVASNAVVIGFNVRIDEGAQELADKEGIEVKIYGIIYEAIQDVVAAMEGLLEPVLKENFVGRALVKQAFRVTKVGTIAGCIVAKGKIVRTGVAKLTRDKKIVYEGKISSLKRFKDDVREVNEGVECGIGLDRHDDVQAGDVIDIFQIEKVARRLAAKG